MNIAFEPVISPVAVILPDIIALPETSNFAFGDVFPIPNNDVSVNDTEFAREVLVGWAGVTGDDGQEIPYSVEAARRLLEVPLVAGAIVQAFFASLTGAKRKN